MISILKRDFSFSLLSVDGNTCFSVRGKYCKCDVSRVDGKVACRTNVQRSRAVSSGGGVDAAAAHASSAQTLPGIGAFAGMRLAQSASAEVCAARHGEREKRRSRQLAAAAAVVANRPAKALEARLAAARSTNYSSAAAVADCKNWAFPSLACVPLPKAAESTRRSHRIGHIL